MQNTALNSKQISVPKNALTISNQMVFSSSDSDLLLGAWLYWTSTRSLLSVHSSPFQNFCPLQSLVVHLKIYVTLLCSATPCLKICLRLVVGSFTWPKTSSLPLKWIIFHLGMLMHDGKSSFQIALFPFHDCSYMNVFKPINFSQSQFICLLHLVVMNIKCKSQA